MATSVAGLRGCGIGDFVTVLPVPPQSESRRGILRFVGPTAFAAGVWAGVELIGSSGRNDGSVMGRVYFRCPPGQGVFVRPELVVPFTPVGGPTMRNEKEKEEEINTGGMLQMVDVLRSDIGRLQQELQKTEGELERVRAALAESAAELEKERERGQTLAEKLEMISQEKKTEEEVQKIMEEKEMEMQRLQQHCTDLKELCDIQEEEINRQREHADDLVQLIEDERRKHEEERSEVQQIVQHLEEEIAQQQQQQQELVNESRDDESARKMDVENMRLQLFQHQQEREAFRLLKERYEKLHAEREEERKEYETKWKHTSSEYEEALTQQREYKNRLMDEIRNLQQKITDMRRSHEHERVLHMPLSVAEREEYESQISQMQWELMQVYEKILAKRYDQFLAPVSRWDSPAVVIKTMCDAISSAAHVLPFTTTDQCLRSRMELFPHRKQ
ncbi:CAP Gly-rich domain [Trypanosoma melophagium]|uniref:CAP Gly-rich domain n=1 Tax=Trypanosoma melophagium TaxID=715481 RepID=UPI00351A8A00|nr:CAP Gly-rich domain [Trypanosoma melophagium]